MLVNEQNETSQDHSDILHPASRALFRYWETIRGASSAPARSDVDLKSIREFIPNLMIIERMPRDAGFRWRLAGTGIGSLFRSELTDSGVTEGWNSFEAGIVNRFLAGVVEGLQPCIIRLRLMTDIGQTIGAELLGLPVVTADGNTVQVFGGVFTFRDIEMLSYNSIQAIELSNARTIWTEHLPGDSLVKILGNNDNMPTRPFHVIAGGRR